MWPRNVTAYGSPGLGPGVTWRYPHLDAALYLASASILPVPHCAECHHCGAPSSGDRCRYCGTVHGEPEPMATNVCPTCRAEYDVQSQADPFALRTLVARVCQCPTINVYEVRDVDVRLHGLPGAIPRLVDVAPNPRRGAR